MAETTVQADQEQLSDPGIQDREKDHLDDPVIIGGVGILVTLSIIGIVNGLIKALGGS